MRRRLLFLNGAPASGKSTVARVFQRQRLTEMGEVWLHVDLDVFTSMPPTDVSLTAAQRDACVSVMQDALTAMMAGPLDLVVELVARDDGSVRQIVDSIRGSGARSGRVEHWLTLTASDQARHERNRIRGSEDTVSVDARLDPTLVDLGKVLDTEQVDVDVCAESLSNAVDARPPDDRS